MIKAVCFNGCGDYSWIHAGAVKMCALGVPREFTKGSLVYAAITCFSESLIKDLPDTPGCIVLPHESDYI